MRGARAGRRARRGHAGAGAGGRRGRVPRAHRPLPARAAGPLLPDPRLGPGRRGPASRRRCWRPGAGSTAFEGRASLRAWLYRIATNRCLNALRDAGAPARAEAPAATADAARAHPPGPSRSGSSPTPTRCSRAARPRAGPGGALRDQGGGRAGVRRRRCSTCRPRQRAVLVLRDVLGFRAAEVADMLDTSEASVNSALQRARATLERALPGADRERAPLPRLAARARARRPLRRRRSRRGDVDGVVALLTDDAWLTMPPAAARVPGPRGDRRLPAPPRGLRGAALRLVPTRANGQPAFGCYLPGPARADRAGPTG